MRSTITLNGKNSSEIEGLLIQSLPPISKPLMRTQIEEIDGRDGDIVTNLGFSAYTKEFTIGLYGDFDINEIISYFNSEGTVTFSNEPDMYYNYQIINQIDFERLIRYRTATVAMHCQPFKYSTTEGADILSSSDNFATLDQSINTDSSFYTYTSNVQDDVTATRNGVANNGKFFAVFTIPVVQGITYYFSGNVSSKVTMYAYTDTLRGTNAGIAGKAFTGNFTYTATFTGTMVLGFYVGLATEIFIRNFFVTNEEAGVISGEGNDIVLEGTTEAPFLTLAAKGDTYQQTYSGKNLFNSYIATKSSWQAGNLVVNADGSLTLSGNTGSNNYFQLGQTLGTLCPNLQVGDEVYLYLDTTSAVKNIYVGQVWGNTYTKTITQAMLDAVVVVYGGYNQTDTLKIMITRAQETTYEPYVGGIASPNPQFPQDIQVVTGEQTVQVTGKNLLNTPDRSQTRYGMTETISNNKITIDGTATRNNFGGTYFNLNGTDNANANYYDYDTSTSGTTLPAGTYTLSIANITGSYTSPSNIFMRVMKTHSGSYPNTMLGSFKITNNERSVTFTLTEETTIKVELQIQVSSDTSVAVPVFNNYSFDLQLESGSATTYEQYQSQSYTINLGSTELCKIGDYQDYIYKSGEDWYVHKETGKQTIDTTAISLRDTYSNVEYGTFTKPNDYIYASSIASTIGNIYCTHATPSTTGNWNNASNAGKLYGTAQVAILWLGFDKGTGLDAIKTKLSGAELYYVLATPTDTKITDSTLIEELDALKNNSHAYKGRTYIKTNSTSSNLPHIIEAEVAGNMDGTVTNSGNTTARPKLTIFGSGNIGISLNGNQIFNIALGDEGHITIDTNAMEAYKDTTNNLKNRLVTGDYSNFVLQAGDNQISFSGNATMCVVENYSRWL